jgi:radical SAM protein with 4Fe4S-binding SPASM domain
MMEMDLIRKALDEIASENPATKVWPAVMGEPLMAGERLFELLGYAHEKGLKVFLNTNGMLLTGEIIERLKEYGVEEIILGLDAATRETYERIRRGGDYVHVKEMAEKMIDAYGHDGPRLILQYIIMAENAHEVEQFRKDWIGKGGIVKIRRKQGWGKLIESEFLGSSERIMPCPWLSRNCLILWNGEVCQCDGDVDNQYTCGNAYQQSIKEIWQGEMKRRRECHYKGDFDFEPCKDCRDWQVGLSQFFFPDEPERAYMVDEKKYK